MNHIEDFLQKLNKLTLETGVVIDVFGDENYNPSATKLEHAGSYDNSEKVFFSYDPEEKTYVGKLGSPYSDEVFFPKDYKG